MKVVITWDIITGVGTKRKLNRWIDDLLGQAYVAENICFCETQWFDSYGRGTPEWTTIAHEMGHVLKLKHTEGAHSVPNVMHNGSTRGRSNRFWWYQIEKLNGTFADRLKPALFY